jgi:hypothetical protein
VPVETKLLDHSLFRSVTSYVIVCLNSSTLGHHEPVRYVSVGIDCTRLHQLQPQLSFSLPFSLFPSTCSIHLFHMSSIRSPIPEEAIDAALAKYTKLTKTDLVNNPLTNTIRRCDSPAAIGHVLRQHANAFRDHNDLTDCLDAVVDGLHSLFTTPVTSEVSNLRVVSSLHHSLHHSSIMFYSLVIPSRTTRFFCDQYPSHGAYFPCHS